MRKNVSRSFIIPTLCASLLLSGPALVKAEGTSADNGWDFAVAAYLWGADIGGTTGSGADIDVSFSDVFSGLNAGFMGIFEARKDKWLVLTDLVYLDVSADNKTDVTIPVGPGLGPGPVPIDIDTKVEIDLKGTVFQLAGGYNLLSEGPLKLDLLAGARYLNLDNDITVNLSSIGGGRKTKFSDDGHVWDGIVV